MAAPTYDVIVIGLGVMGSAAAYHLARDGQKVLALEQLALDHRMGSSYGESRIIRYAYQHAVYMDMAKAAYPLWRALEDESGTMLMSTVGGFDFGSATAPSLLETRDNLTAAGIPFEWLSRAEAMRRFPQFHLDDGMAAIFQADAGFLRASACVITQTQQAERHGAVIRTETPVTDIDLFADHVRIHTATEIYEAARLVIAAGPWMPKVLAKVGLTLPLQPTREQIVFFTPADKDSYLPDCLPIFIAHDMPWHYGLPNVDGNGFKAAIHIRNEATDPDTTNRKPDDDYIAEIREWVAHYLPGGAGVVNEARVCLYTMTPDEHFVIDRHPAYPHVVLAGGMSGHGFKFGILIGKILADLVTRGATDQDIEMFRLDRFGA